MPKKPETKLREKADRLLKALPASHWFSIQQKTIKGTPDKLGCVNGVFVAIEFKSGKGKLTALQDYNLVKVRDAGGIALMVNEETLDYSIDLLRRIASKEFT